jgi:NADPH-dependent glutamate synthase beta subunit-like oxidoreductase
MDVDYVVMAIGSQLEDGILKDIKKNNFNKIEIDENYKTNVKKVFAAGDVAGVKSTVAWASFSGREAAKKIYNYLKEEN